MSPALNESSALLYLECDNAVEVCNGIIFNYCLIICIVLYPLADKKTQLQILCFILAVIAALFGMALWIALGLVVSNGSKSGPLVTSPFSLYVTRYLPGNVFVVKVRIFLGNNYVCGSRCWQFYCIISKSKFDV